MWQMEPPAIHLDTPVMVAQVTRPTTITQPKSRAMGVCEIVKWNTQYDDYLELSPDANASTYMYDFEGKSIYFNQSEKNTTINLIKAPKHGRLDEDVFAYYPNKNYLGNDLVIFEVKKAGAAVKIHYHIHVLPGIGDGNNYESECGNRPNPWRINQSIPVYWYLVSGVY